MPGQNHVFVQGLMGYSNESKAYRLQDSTTGKIIISRDAVFIEEKVCAIENIITSCNSPVDDIGVEEIAISGEECNLELSMEDFLGFDNDSADIQDDDGDAVY